ncbi:hypothetical protein Slin_7013 (plasmid) [Spirosoma linguale DSM 74]|uniref:Uncharacterized protein n=2 Tax=Spirosoma TaxID=107 RepID=D2QVX4_SPILD|nr:hypothetical protein Slin_7013 [Spirosoma linguale DSM 74]
MFLATSCGAGWSDYTEEIEEGYTWVNEGDPVNVIISDVKGVNSLAYLRKYCNNGAYICAWQADSAQIHRSGLKSGGMKENSYVYDSSDRFYIIDVKGKHQYGPYQKDAFFTKVKSLNIHVSWKPISYQ